MRVLVKNNKIISFGVTGINGRPHAETNAIKNSKKNVAGSTVICNYLNLVIIMENTTMYKFNY